MKIAGIDEAGRGPVIGPMVMAIVSMEPEQEIILKNMGAKDSKLLSPDQRERLFDLITKQFEYDLIILSPQEIDHALFSDNMNLNWLEAITSAKLINGMKKVDKVLVDCPSNNVPAYSAYLKQRLENQKINLIAEHKADAKYVIVSAASIIAKVTRDREIEKLKKKHHVEFGSGYPSDPFTVEFLQKNYTKDFPFFRKSWQSYKRLAGEKKQKKLFDEF